jgi:hypothetical protein
MIAATVSAKERVAQWDRYFDAAVDDEACAQRWQSLPTNVQEPSVKKRVYYEPDDDLRRAITIDVLHRRVKEDVHQWYKERNESSSTTGGTAVS